MEADKWKVAGGRDEADPLHKLNAHQPALTSVHILCCPPARKGQLDGWLPNISHSLPTWQAGTREITTAEMKRDPADQCETSICPVRGFSELRRKQMIFFSPKWSGEAEREKPKPNETKPSERSSICQAYCAASANEAWRIKAKSHCACWHKAVFTFYLILVAGG